MGSIVFEKGCFGDNLHEVIGFKSGLAASIEHMCDLLTGTGYEDELLRSEEYGIRLRTEDYESAYYHLLNKIGVTESPKHPMVSFFEVNKKLEEIGGIEFSMAINEIYRRHISLEIQKAEAAKNNKLDPTNMLDEAMKRYGKKGFDSLFMVIESFNNLLINSPNSSAKFHQYTDIIELDELFKTYKPVSTEGLFLDQRFIDFLSVNGHKIGEIHWRKFEELTAECFSRFGYKVELGPGSNDDGVDIRVWNDEIDGAPKYIIQCKRVKSLINKVTIKGLYADTLHEGSELGLLVTSSELSPGARNTIAARSYPIEEVNGTKIREWLAELRTPGTGIVRF